VEPKASVTLKIPISTRFYSFFINFPPDLRMPTPFSHKIAVLVFIQNEQSEHLLLLRTKAPNQGAWSPIGGKLETATGESPFECAVRETAEETGHIITAGDLHLFAMIAEKSYEGSAHWLMFLFDCKRPLTRLPPAMAEGRFGFFSRTAIEALAIPDSDRNALWPIYDNHRGHFVALRADCHPDSPLKITVEQITPAP
jgi:8-oxo-dGTP diphosphatase